MLRSVASIRLASASAILLSACSLIVDDELGEKSVAGPLDAGPDARVHEGGGNVDDDAGSDDGGRDAGGACPPDRQDNDDDGVCEPTCATATIMCREHERCDDEGGTARCVCVPGHQDNDGDGTCAEDCTNLTCGDHEHCEDASGTAACVCDEGYEGKNCDTCADDFQDNDADGSCLPTCEGSGLDCGSRGTCQDTGGEAVCLCDFNYVGETCRECELGYVLDGGICKWDGLVMNSAFDDEAGWMTHGSGDIDGGGFAKLPHDATCEGGSVSQTVTVPPLANADVLVLRYDVRLGSGFDTGPRPYVMLDGQPYPSDTTNFTTWTANSVCLGARAYGGDLAIVLRAARTEGNAVCTAYEDADFDNVRIEPAGSDECPTPGSGVFNGEFSMSGGWTLTSATGSADIAGDEMTMSALGSTTVSAEGKAALPIVAGGDGLAVEVTWTATVDDELTVYLNGYRIGVTTYLGSMSVTRTCVPSWTHGGTMPIELAARDPNGNGVTMMVASVHVVEDNRCTDSRIFQADFEPLTGTPELISPWAYALAANMQVPAPVGAISDAAGPTKALDLQVSYKCTNVSGSQFIQVPEPSGTEGPAVQFVYTLDNEPATYDPAFRVCLGVPGSNECKTQTAAAAFTFDTFCLDPVRAGQVMQLNFYLEGGGGACAAQYVPAYRARVDDIVVTTSAGCPAE